MILIKEKKTSDPKPHKSMIYHRKLRVNQCDKPCRNKMWQLQFRRVPRDAPNASLKSTFITPLVSLHSLSQTNTKLLFISIIVIVGYLIQDAIMWEKPCH